jgi:mitochondrial fission protein ELM1
LNLKQKQPTSETGSPGISTKILIHDSWGKTGEKVIYRFQPNLTLSHFSAEFLSKQHSGKRSRQFSHFLPITGKPNPLADKQAMVTDKLNL